MKNLFKPTQNYCWDVVEYFRTDKDLVDGVEWITKILSFEQNKIDGKILEINRTKKEVKIGFNKKTDRQVYLMGSNKYVNSYANSQNLVI